jgi:hypothetical protein
MHLDIHFIYVYSKNYVSQQKVNNLQFRMDGVLRYR